MDFTPIFENYRLYLDGLVVTLQLVFWALAFGLALAIPLAILRMSSNPLVNGPVWAFTYFFRGTPLLVQMFLFYYGLGQLQFMIELSQRFARSEEHTSDLQSLLRSSYAVFCLKKTH